MGQSVGSVASKWNLIELLSVCLFGGHSPHVTDGTRWAQLWLPVGGGLGQHILALGPEAGPWRLFSGESCLDSALPHRDLPHKYGLASLVQSKSPYAYS